MSEQRGRLLVAALGFARLPKLASSRAIGVWMTRAVLVRLVPFS